MVHHSKITIVPGSSRPLITGQGMTKNEISFFKKPKTQQDVIEFCKGDQWEANHLQTKLVRLNLITVHPDASMELIDWSGNIS